MSGPNYSVNNLWSENIEEIRDNPNSRKDYIRKYADRTGQSFELVWYKCCTDDSYITHFAKDPRRQNVYENIAAKWIQNIPGISDFKKLPSDGPEALYVQNGRILRPQELANDNTPKSIDFYWTVILPGTDIEVKFYAAHKHTHEDGGSQDNQLEDLKNFTRAACELKKDMGYRIISLADGDYYTKPRVKLGGSCHLDSLKAISKEKSSEYVEAMKCADLPQYIMKCLQQLAVKYRIDNPELQYILNLIENKEVL